MTDKTKKEIDDMPYEAMLRRWRFAPIGDPMFTGEVGEYYSEVMATKRNQVGNKEHVAASKHIGWER
jgi:hypothetical protein